MNFFNDKGEIDSYQLKLHMNQMNMKHPKDMSSISSISYDNCNLKNRKNSQIDSFNSKETLDWQKYTFDDGGEINNKDTFLIDIPNSRDIEISDELKLEEMYKCYEQNFRKEQLNKNNNSTIENKNQLDQNRNTNNSLEEQTSSYFINMYKPKKDIEETQEQINEMYEFNNKYQNNNANYSMNHTQLTALQESQKSFKDIYINAGATNSQQTLHYDSRGNFDEIIQQHPFNRINHPTMESKLNQYTNGYKINNEIFNHKAFKDLQPQELYTEEVTTPNLNCSIPKEEIINRIVKECANQNQTIQHQERQENYISNPRNQINTNILHVNNETEPIRKNETTDILYNGDNLDQRGNYMSGFITRRTLGIQSNNENVVEHNIQKRGYQNQINEKKMPFVMNGNNENNKNWYETTNPGTLKELYSIKHRGTTGNRSQVNMRGTHTLQPQSNIMNNTSYINGKDYMNAQINEQYNIKNLKDIMPEPKLYGKHNFDVPEIVQGITTQHINGIVNNSNADTILKYKDTWRLVPSKRCSLNQQCNAQATQRSLEEFQKRLDESNAQTKQNIMNANFNALTGELTMNHKKEDYSIDPNKVYNYNDAQASFPSYNNSLVNEKIAQINASLINQNNKKNDKTNHFNNINEFPKEPHNNETSKINANVENRKIEKDVLKKRMPKKQNLALCGDTILKYTIKEFVSNKMKDYFNINLFNHYI